MKKRFLIAVCALALLLSAGCAGKVAPLETEDAGTESGTAAVSEDTEEETGRAADTDTDWLRQYERVTAAFRAYLTCDDRSEFYTDGSRYTECPGAFLPDDTDTSELEYHWNCMAAEERDCAGHGYFLYDINSDGVPELFIARPDAYSDGSMSITAVFTVSGGRALLLDCFWSRDRGFLLSDGNLYTSGSGGAEYSIYEVKTLPAGSGILETVDSFGTDRGEHYREDNGKRVIITDGEFSGLVRDDITDISVFGLIPFIEG